ncbi:glycosyltransferase [Planktomarina sp.]|nr:glycosyltransferase [Planktomarina sp.]
MLEAVLISFVIPSFNDDRILETIRSIHECEVPEHLREIVIYDGGSSDTLVESIKNLLSKNDSIFVERDNGIFDAINKGLRIAKGHYILTLGSDDRLCDLPLDTLLYARKENVDLMMFDIEYTNQSWKRLRIWTGHKVSLFNYYLGMQYAHFGLICTKQVYEEIGFFNADNKVNADYEFFYALCKNASKYRQHIVPKTIVQMRIGGNSSASLKTILFANFKMLRFMARTDPFLIPGLFLKPAHKSIQFLKARLKSN